MIIFGSVQFLYKKITKRKPVQTDRFRFNFFRTKTCSNRFGSVFSFWLGFLPVWLGFFRLGSVRFGFFGFRFIKPKPNRTGLFFQNFNRFNRFFSRFGFFSNFFLVFSVFQFFCSPLVWALSATSQYTKIIEL